MKDLEFYIDRLSDLENIHKELNKKRGESLSLRLTRTEDREDVTRMLIGSLFTYLEKSL